LQHLPHLNFIGAPIDQCWTTITAWSHKPASITRGFRGWQLKIGVGLHNVTSNAPLQCRNWRTLIVVNVGGGPSLFAFRGQYELKAELPHVIAVSPGVAPFSNSWRKPVGERWYGCSLRQ
jgi:hypothetical protein